MNGSLRKAAAQDLQFSNNYILTCECSHSQSKPIGRFQGIFQSESHFQLQRQIIGSNMQHFLKTAFNFEFIAQSTFNQHGQITKNLKNANPATKVVTLDGAVTKHIIQMYQGGPVLHCLGQHWCGLNVIGLCYFLSGHFYKNDHWFYSLILVQA